MLGMIVGSYIGGYIPTLIWHTSLLSFAGIICTAIGGFVGIYFAFKISYF